MKKVKPLSDELEYSICSILLRLNQVFFGTLIVLQFVSCSRKAAGFRTATLWASETHEKTRYSLKIPKKCNCQYEAQENAREKIYTYPDSSYIFLADNETMGLIPREAVKKYGQGVYAMFTHSDDTTTIGINGIDTTGRFFKIRRTGGAIYGYQRVPAANRSKFDSVLNSLTTQIFPLNYKVKPEVYENMGNLIYGDFLGKCKRF